jgi:hypothetical protein
MRRIANLLPALTLLALLLAGAPAEAREPQVAEPAAPRASAGQGTQYFRFVLKQVRAKPLDDPNKLLDNPKNTLLIVLGQTDVLDRWLDRHALRDEFLLKGGSLLIATDRHTSDDLKDEIGVQVSGKFEYVDLRSDPQAAWRGMPECPLVQEVRSWRGRHPIFVGLPNPPRVATNKPSSLSYWGIFPIATLPVMGEDRFGPIRRLAPMRFAVAHQFPEPGGRLLVLADHSLFINEMMAQPDNDNAEFAFNVALWLTDNGQRTDVLFYDDGTLQTSFDVSLELPSPQFPPLEALVPLFNQVLNGLQRENFFNKNLLKVFGGRAALLRTAALVLTLAVAVFGLYRFLHARHRVEPKVPRLPVQLAVLAPSVPAVEQRHQAVLARGNLSEAARELARQAFTALGVPPAAGAAAPAFTVAGPWWWRLVWGRRVRRLWELAALGRTDRVSPAGLRRLAAGLQQLRAAAEGGKLHFAAAK